MDILTIKSLKDVVAFIRDVGIDTVISAVTIVLGARYVMKKMGEKKCIHSDSFVDLRKEIRELRMDMKSFRSLFEGFLTGFKYRGKDDE